jgi:uncharacterized MAPEG superfamily protein
MNVIILHITESLRIHILSPQSTPEPTKAQLTPILHSVNPSGLLIGPIFTPLYLAFVPLTSYLTRPGPGLLNSTLNALTYRMIPSLPKPLPDSARIPALAALYTFVAFGATGAFSAGGQAAGRAEGLDNNEPRTHHAQLRGLPGRLRAAHLHLCENFAAWAVSAGLAVALGQGGDAHIEGLLKLVVVLKCYGEYSYSGLWGIQRGVVLMLWGAQCTTRVMFSALRLRGPCPMLWLRALVSMFAGDWLAVLEPDFGSRMGKEKWNGIHHPGWIRG